MRSSSLPITLATLALFLSFQEQCRAQAQAVVEEPQAGSSSMLAIAYPSSSRLGRQQEAAIQRRAASRKASLSRRQLLDDNSEPAVIVKAARPSTSSSSSTTEDDDDSEDALGLSRDGRVAAATESIGRAAGRTTELNIPRPGAPTSAMRSIAVTETDTQSETGSSKTESSTSSSASSTSSSVATSSSSSTSSSESSSSETSSTAPTSSPSQSTTSQLPSTVSSATPTSNSSSAPSATNSSVPLTSVWQAYNKSSKYFPVAVAVTVVVGIAILVALVAILQCIARMPRFRKNSERPLLIPRDSSWSDSTMTGGSASGGLESGDNSRRGSIISQGGRVNRNNWETFTGASTVAARVPSNLSSRRDSRYEPPATSQDASTPGWAKEDFLPHSARGGSEPTTPSYAVVDVYPSLPKFPRTPPASSFGGPYPTFPASPMHIATPAPYMSQPFQSTTLPVIRRMDPAIHSAQTQQQQQQQPMMQRLSRGPSILFKPRPGPTEQQSGHRQSLSGRGLPPHVLLPEGVAERRRWERCST